MKKAIALFLLVALAVGLCACSASLPGNKNEVRTGVFQAGFGREVVNPTRSVPLSGYGNEKYRYSDEIACDVCATAIAVTDENDNTFIMIEMDLVKIYDYFVNEVRAQIHAATGVPEENIMVSASHTHASVHAFVEFDIYITDEYLPWLEEHTALAGIKAFNDRKPAKLFAGSIETEGMNFVRQYAYEDDSGKTLYCSDNYGEFLMNDSTRHVKQADPTIHLLQFKREGGNDIILANFRGHPHFDDGLNAYKLSSDYPGYWRDAMEFALGCNFIFFQGAAGNINTSSRIKTEVRAAEVNQYAYLLTKYCEDCLNSNMKEITDHAIQLRHSDLVEEANHSEDSKATFAQSVVDQYNNSGGNMTVTKELALSLGLHSYYHATSILAKTKLAATQTEHFDAIAIGKQVAFVFAPNELFDVNSEWLEEQSPYNMTMTMGYSNIYGLYMPSDDAFDFGCYEVDVTRAARGTAEQIQNNFLSMLKDMHG